MTARETTDLIGTQGTITLDGLQVRVRILDARESFGRLDVLVTPLEGSGERWCDSTRVKREGT